MSARDDGGTGTVAALFRYPVKSMQAEPLSTVEVSWHGLAGDRRWAFLRPNTERNGFPWHTLRQQATLGAYQPFLVHPDRPDRSPVTVRTPSGEHWDVTDHRLAVELGRGVRVLKQDRGVFDSAPLSIVTTSSLNELSRLTDLDLDVLRFRPNLLLAVDSPAAFPEEQWVGRTLRVGRARIRIDRQDQRCSVINLDPRSGARAPSILRTVAKERSLCVGVYASTTQPGLIAVGDPVILE